MPADIIGTDVLEEDQHHRARGSCGSWRGRCLPTSIAGRRDQPHAAQDAGRAARGHAGAAGERGPRAPPPGGSVLRAGHAEPDRAGGHLPAARKPSRIASCSRCSSAIRRFTRSSRSPGGRPAARRRCPTGARGRRDPRPPGGRPRGADQRPPRRATALGVVRQTRRGERGVPDSCPTNWPGRGAAGGAVPHRRRPGRGRCCRAATTRAWKTSRPWRRRCCRHRIVVGFAAESEGVTPDAIIERIIETTPAREDELTRDARFQTIFAS